MIKADDEALDPWKQAEKELGDAAEPRAHAVQGFLYNEMEFCYGHGSVAAVNPVGHTSAGSHMCVTLYWSLSCRPSSSCLSSCS
jgi:hypothetical protein